ncbi:MAG: hypothetical protein V7637_5855 [Mycobacteriales bacterium]
MLPISTFTRSAYTVVMPDGTRFLVRVTEGFHTVELASPTEMLRYGGSIHNGLLPDFPIAWVIPVPVPGIPGYNILLILRAYVTMERGLLLPGSDDVYQQPGRRAHAHRRLTGALAVRARAAGQGRKCTVAPAGRPAMACSSR